MSTIASLYVANVKEFVRDRAALFWTFAFPLIFIVLFGLIYSNNGSVTFNVVLIDQDHTAASQGLIAAFHHEPIFKIKSESETKAISDIKSGSIDGLIVVPAGFSASLGTRTPAAVQMTNAGSANSSSASTAQIEQQVVQQVLASFNQSVSPYTPPATLEVHSVTSQNLSSISYLAPGIMAMALMQLGLFATVAPLVTLRQEQVLRRLGATPLPRSQLLVSQVLFGL